MTDRLKTRIVVYERQDAKSPWVFQRFITEHNNWVITTCGEIAGPGSYYALHQRNNATDSMGQAYEAEQCTGLKDKHGRLIYEGDIVKATFKYMGSNTENLCFVVAFSDGAFGYFDELGRFGLLANFGTGAMFEVIGNIHETPELLREYI